MYVAVSDAVTAIVPNAKLGPANFAADGPDRTTSWTNVIVPIVKGITAARARVDFMAMSSYGRAIGCAEPGFGPNRDHVAATVALGSTDVCEYSWESAGLTAARLASVHAMLPDEGAGIPMEVMEYGDQQNKRGNVDSEPGAWGGAWTLTSSIQFALHGIQRAYHWGFGDRNFANGQTICAAPLSRCGLYGGNIWISAAAGHLFGKDNATVLANKTTVANITFTVGSHPALSSSEVSFRNGNNDGGAVASGIGGWGQGGELRLLVSLFHPRKDLHDPAQVSIQFVRPKEWGKPGSKLLPMKYRSMVLNTSTSVYDAVHREANSTNTLRTPGDPNVYVLSKMLTEKGINEVKANAEKWFAMQHTLFTPSKWMTVAADNRKDNSYDEWSLSCGDYNSDSSNEADQLCSVQFSASPPSSVALWFAPR